MAHTCWNTLQHNSKQTFASFKILFAPNHHSLFQITHVQSEAPPSASNPIHDI